MLTHAHACIRFGFVLVSVSVLAGLSTGCPGDGREDGGTAASDAGKDDSGTMVSDAGEDDGGTLEQDAGALIDAGGGGPTDITDAVFSGREANCAAYTEHYYSTVLDVGQQMSFAGEVSFELSGNTCIVTSNGIPNHDFNDGAMPFPNAVSAQSQIFEMTQSPAPAANPTPLALTMDNGIMLNGVKVDVLAAGCFGIGDGKVGCNDMSTPWRYDPLFVANGFRVDSHNAHAQPNGAYHYHGPPHALFDETGAEASGLIGFAADGFPIFGSFFDDGTGVRRALSNYELKPGMRPSGEGEPGGAYDGTFRDDYVHNPDGPGDLDACNGMTTPDGIYGYFITETYPWILGCFTGTPDASFNK